MINKQGIDLSYFHDNYKKNKETLIGDLARIDPQMIDTIGKVCKSLDDYILVHNSDTLEPYYLSSLSSALCENKHTLEYWIHSININEELEIKKIKGEI